MEDFNEEFEPLFDYTRIQPRSVVCLDDDPDESPMFCSKKRKTPDSSEEKKESDVNVKDLKVIACDDDDEDWLCPPPKNLDNSSTTLEEDPTLKALRLKKQELASLAQSAEEVMRAVEESVRKDLHASSQSSPKSATKQASEPSHERAKLVISIQDKDGLKQFRVYSDDKFERLFKMYADKTKLDVRNLVFSFDGDKVGPSQTPDSLGMEEDDIIEVHVKSSPKSATNQPLEPCRERAKIVISIQDKDGLKQFRVYTDDKFEQLFKIYADRTKLDVRNLVFSFDGDKIGPLQTPDSLGMEENDIIEVHVKSS